MPTQGTLQTVYGAETPGVPGRGEHQSTVPVSAEPSLSQSSHGRRSVGRQELHRGQYPHVFGLLHAGRSQNHKDAEKAKMIITMLTHFNLYIAQ